MSAGEKAPASPLGLGRNYTADRPIGAVLREHREWATQRMDQIDRLEVSDQNAAGAGFVTVWAVGPLSAELVDILDDPFGVLVFA